jgi:riboflavin kinase/FMN adenylyltransferase
MAMRIVHDLAQARPASRSYVTIGVFDGVHRGHQRLITDMVEAARSGHGSAVAITFDPHPATTLGYEPPLLLTTVEERAELLAALGLDVLVILPFTSATARTRAADFVETLTHHLCLIELWGGPGFGLGYQREGDVPFLRHLGAERGFAVRVVEPLVWAGELVSSSRVRAALEAGDIPEATGCLGRPYRLTGLVVRGDGRGHNIGVPTANLSPLPGRLIPAGGTYACLAHTEHLGRRPAVVNVGTRPTFTGSPHGQALVVEAHLLDFDADLYGQALALDFVARLRDERTFPTPDALVEQIHNDIAHARVILGSSRTVGRTTADDGARRQGGASHSRYRS